ncbi:MAG: hypothetical protein F4X64_01550 [Chloroflexi bacterium]|nr:hypothetical protein [Chloroflexota bacterium]
MVRYVPKTVRERGRVHLAERLAAHGWQCFIARRSPNEDEVIAGRPEQDIEVRLKFHSQESSQAVRFYNPDTLDWDWEYLVITTYILEDTPVSYLLSRADVSVDGRMDDEFGGALWLQPEVFTDADFREAWYKLDGA